MFEEPFSFVEYDDTRSKSVSKRSCLPFELARVSAALTSCNGIKCSVHVLANSTAALPQVGTFIVIIIVIIARCFYVYEHFRCRETLLLDGPALS